MSNEALTIAGVREAAGRVTIRVASDRGCTGVGPVEQADAIVVALPPSDAPVDLERCSLPAHSCGPVP
jgi:hypothetical protein